MEIEFYMHREESRKLQILFIYIIQLGESHKRILHVQKTTVSLHYVKTELSLVPWTVDLKFVLLNPNQPIWAY